MFGQPTTRAALRPLVGDLRQLASVRRVVLDDGAERGVRALAFSTGGGLDFWALADRCLDIGPLWFRGIPIAWQGPAGFASGTLLNRADDAGRGLERAMSGLLVTCGMEHIRKPEGGVLHGHLPLTPARVLAYNEDWDRAEPVLFCEGEVTQWRLNGEALRLHRRIEAPVGGTMLRITDQVENLGAAPQPLALLYHFNLGFPVLGEGTRLSLDGKPLPLPGSVPVCHQAGPGWACCRVSAPAGTGAPIITFGFDSAALPFLQLWRQPSAGTRILGVEPCTSGRLPGSSGPGPVLAPGERRTARLELHFTLPPA